MDQKYAALQVYCMLASKSIRASHLSPILRLVSIMLSTYPCGILSTCLFQLTASISVPVLERLLTCSKALHSERHGAHLPSPRSQGRVRQVAGCFTCQSVKYGKKCDMSTRTLLVVHARMISSSAAVFGFIRVASMDIFAVCSLKLNGTVTFANQCHRTSLAASVGSSSQWRLVWNRCKLVLLPRPCRASLEKLGLSCLIVSLFQCRYSRHRAEQAGLPQIQSRFKPVHWARHALASACSAFSWLYQCWILIKVWSGRTLSKCRWQDVQGTHFSVLSIPCVFQRQAASV